MVRRRVLCCEAYDSCEDFKSEFCLVSYRIFFSFEVVMASFFKARCFASIRLAQRGEPIVKIDGTVLTFSQVFAVEFRIAFNCDFSARFTSTWRPKNVSLMQQNCSFNLWTFRTPWAELLFNNWSSSCFFWWKISNFIRVQISCFGHHMTGVHCWVQYDNSIIMYWICCYVMLFYTVIWCFSCISLTS